MSSVALNRFSAFKMGVCMSSVDMPRLSGRLLKAETLAFTFALLAQSATGIWWLSSVEGRLTNLEKAVTVLADANASNAHQASDIARIDERTKGIEESLIRVEKRLDPK